MLVEFKLLRYRAFSFYLQVRSSINYNLPIAIQKTDHYLAYMPVQLIIILYRQNNFNSMFAFDLRFNPRNRKVRILNLPTPHINPFSL